MQVVNEVDGLVAAIAALESQRAALGDTVLQLAVAPLRERLAALQRPSGLQHRQVTVMFADVVGSTAMASGIDAEDTLDILSGTLQRMAGIVQAEGGRVLQFTGDGIKAAFGMDVAREDDAERAVRAGLAILQAGREQARIAHADHGIVGFAVRVGVHTGDVALGAGVEADKTAMGAAVHIAARMEQSAPPGTLRISDDTWAQVRGLFEAEPQEPLQVKGIDAPMRTHLVQAARVRGFAGAERGLQGLLTPMIGRDHELQRLLEAVDDARRTRQLQAVTLVGDAGLGKSRLLREALAALSAAAAGCDPIAVRCHPDGMLRPWGLLRSLLATRFGIADTDDAEVARVKVVEGLVPWFEDRPVRQAQILGHLSGLDFGDSPHVRALEVQALRDEAFAALRGFLRALAARGPLPLLVVEDLHWADEGSLDLLQDLVAHAAELPLALVMTGRPALLARRPGWRPAETIVRLAPLGASHRDDLARALLHRMADVPDRLKDLVVGRAEGNPYYMEELVRRLIDDGVIVVGEHDWTVAADRLQSVRLPATLVGLLQARLDALPAHERLAVRQASVIGHVFWDHALQAMDAKAPEALAALEDAAFVRTSPTSDFEGTDQRQFDHHLLHQVTYDTLLKAERRLGHAAVARWLRERTRGRGAEFLAMTGEHAEKAGETALAADCFEQAGQEAKRRYANAAAVAWLRRAIDLLGDSDPGRRIDLLASLGEVHDTSSDWASQESIHEEIALHLTRQPDGLREAQLGFSRALLADRLSELATSERLAREAFDLSERHGAARWAAMSQAQLAWLHLARLDYDGSLRHAEIGLHWAARIEAEEPRAESENQLMTLSGMVALRTWRLADARRLLNAVLARGEALGKPRAQIGALENLAAVANACGRYDEAIDYAKRACTLALAMGSVARLAGAQRRIANASKALGDFATGRHWHEKALELFRQIGDRRSEGHALRFLGDLHLDSGDAATALQHLERAQVLHQALRDPTEACEVAALVARCHVALGRHDAARDGVEALLDRLTTDLADRMPADTFDIRSNCAQTLEALGDPRAAALVAQLFAYVRTNAANLTEPDDVERLIMAMPHYRKVAAAQRRLNGGQSAPGDL